MANGTRQMGAHISCRLSRSAFSGERVFHVALGDGEDYTGVSPVHYCRTKDLRPLSKDEPKPGKRIDGVIEVEVLENGGEVATIELPDGHSLVIPNGRV